MRNPVPALMHGVAGGAAFVMVAAAMFGPAVLDTLNRTPTAAAATLAAPTVSLATPEPTLDGNWTTETVTLPRAAVRAPRTENHTSLPSTGEATVRIPSLRIDRSVHVGGQRTIDQNRVAHYDGWSSTFAAVGQSGVYWLAAHNSRTGGPFTSLPRIRKGADIVITTRDGSRYTYRVTGTVVVPPRVQRSVVWGAYGPNDGPPRAVLQTCVGKKRLLVYASLV